MENDEVQPWLNEERERIKHEAEQSSEPNDTRNLFLMLSAYESFDDELDKCMEHLGAAGYSVFKLGPYHKLAAERGYRDAALAYVTNILSQYQHRDREDVEWILANIARKLYHASDRAGGVRHLREALELSRKHGKKDEFMHYWLCYELGLLLQDSDPQAAPALFKEAAEGLSEIAEEGRIIWWGEDMDRAVEAHCKILAGINIDADRLEDELQRRIAASEKGFPVLVLQRALADLRLSQEQPEDVVDPLEASIAQLENLEYGCPVWNMLDQLVALYGETDQLDRGRDYLSNLVTMRDAELPARHPRRAFLRVHLAEILLKMEGQKSEAREVLQQAQSIFQLHEIIPEHVHAKVAEMLAEAAAPAGVGQYFAQLPLCDYVVPTRRNCRRQEQNLLLNIRSRIQ
jgi:tetratricopeptide (TPR) repeat protein